MTSNLHRGTGIGHWNYLPQSLCSGGRKLCLSVSKGLVACTVFISIERNMRHVDLAKSRRENCVTGCHEGAYIMKLLFRTLPAS